MKTHLFSAYQHVWSIRGVSRNALYKCTILTYLLTIQIRKIPEKWFVSSTAYLRFDLVYQLTT